MSRLMLYSTLLVCAGCHQAFYQEDLPSPVTPANVIEMTKEGKTPEEILEIIRHARMVYDLSVKEIKEMLDAEVKDDVIDYMNRTRAWQLSRAIQRQRYFSWGYYDPYWWPRYRYWGHHHYPW